MAKTITCQSIEGTNPVVVLQFMPADNDPLPAVPVMPETLLLLDLVVQEPTVDLRAMSQLVLDDMGATLQILRLAGREYGSSPHTPRRIEDCISDLGVMTCRVAVSEQTASRHSRQAYIARTWAHAREIAQYARKIAIDLPRVNPEEAYMVGLLHSLASLPAVLGWNNGRELETNDPLHGWQLAKQWSLPHPLLEYFSEMIIPGCETRWLQIVRAAHQRASRSLVNCPFEMELRPGLIKQKCNNHT